MFRSTGRIEIANGIRVKVEGDICSYYRKLFAHSVYFTKKSQLPTYGAHISIVLPEIHKIVDYSLATGYSGKVVDFYYDPENTFISKKNIWINVNLPIGEEVKKLFNIQENNFWGYHLVVCNFKF